MRFALLSVAGAWLAIQIAFFVDIAVLHVWKPSSTTFSRNDARYLCAQKQVCKIEHEWVDYESVSDKLKHAIIASEDANFVDHNGIEIKSILKAWERNQTKGQITMGGSTITQQLAKNLFLSGEQTLARKGQELLITFYLESLLSKQQIYELYLNSVEFGAGIYGAQAASLHYFNRQASQLNAYQASQLASALPAPKCFDDKSYCNNKIAFNKRSKRILKRMGQADIPSDDDLDLFFDEYAKKQKN